MLYRVRSVLWLQQLVIVLISELLVLLLLSAVGFTVSIRGRWIRWFWRYRPLKGGAVLGLSVVKIDCLFHVVFVFFSFQLTKLCVMCLVDVLRYLLDDILDIGLYLYILLNLISRRTLLVWSKFIGSWIFLLLLLQVLYYFVQVWQYFVVVHRIFCYLLFNCHRSSLGQRWLWFCLLLLLFPSCFKWR